MMVDSQIVNGETNAVCFECRRAEHITVAMNGSISRTLYMPAVGFWGEEVKPIDLPPFDIPPAQRSSEFYEVMKKYTAELEQQLYRGLMIPAADFNLTTLPSTAATYEGLDAATAIKKLFKQWEWKAAFRKQLASPESVQVYGSDLAPKDKVMIAPGWDGKFFIVCHKDDFAEVKQTVEEAHKRLTSKAT